MLLLSLVKLATISQCKRAGKWSELSLKKKKKKIKCETPFIRKTLTFHYLINMFKNSQSNEKYSIPCYLLWIMKQFSYMFIFLFYEYLCEFVNQGLDSNLNLIRLFAELVWLAFFFMMTFATTWIKAYTLISIWYHCSQSLYG